MLDLVTLPPFPVTVKVNFVRFNIHGIIRTIHGTVLSVIIYLFVYLFIYLLLLLLIIKLSTI